MRGYGIPRRRDSDVVDCLRFGAPSREMKMTKRHVRRRLWKKVERQQAKRDIREERNA
jgi:hypothetical protein